ncbi:MAG: ABC transporter ATP-binding protein [Planctomycetota bacterium]
MTATLEFHGVSKWYGQVSALTEVDLCCGPGVTGLVGQNGAGKSTLMKLAAGLLNPSTGEVSLCGERPTRRAARSVLGYCPDIDRFYEEMSGRNFVAWMLRLDGMTARAAKARAGEVLDELGLGEAMHRRIGGYSKGMRQRVKLAQALGKRPSVLLLDEPLTGLDPVARHEVTQVVRGIGQSGVCVLVSSHVLHELQNFADAGVALIHQGRLLAHGAVAELRAQMGERPHRLRLRSEHPRELASRLAALDVVASVSVGDDDVRIETRAVAGAFAELTRVGASARGLITELQPLDDDLEAVFGYLVS